MIIALGGIDGCGKGTQAELLSKALSNRDEETGMMHFPEYSTPFGKLIQQWLRGMVEFSVSGLSENEQKDANALAFQGLCQANKSEYAAMIKKYEDRSYLILDRYWFCAPPYGSSIDGLDWDYMVSLGDAVPRATLNVFLDIPPEEAIRRQVARGKPLERYEGKVKTLYDCRRGYLELWYSQGIKPNNGAWVVIDGTNNVQEVHESIMAWVDLIGSSRFH